MVTAVGRTEILPLAPDTSPAIARTAKTVLRTLRANILAMEEGAYLGSGKDLCQQFEISRPTFHQVARALEHEELISVRRGPNGGYYAKRPSLSSATASVATYLRSRDTQLSDFVGLGQMLHGRACELAADCADETLRADLQMEVEEFWGLDARPQPEMVLRRDYTLEGHLFVMAGNPVIELFMRSMHHFNYVIITEDALGFSDERVDAWMTYRRKLCEAILEREPLIAVAISQTHWQLLNSWLDIDMEQQRATNL